MSRNLSAHSIQLGTIHLESIAGPSSNPAGEKWSTLLPSILAATDIDPSDHDIILSLSFLLSDEAIGFHADYRRVPSGLLIRASIVHSDAPGATWGRIASRKGNRRMHLRRLFHHLRRSWDGGEDWVMGRRSEDELKMPDLYSALPSPPEPEFPPGLVHTPMDREVFSRLTYYEEPEGIKTKMYEYQFRSVGRMLRMETHPDRLVDLQFTPFEEAGTDRTYYVNTATWDVQRHPGWYDLPRGGILCEQMGTGKTLMCLALIVATLHNPPTPPPEELDMSPVLSDRTLSTYPFEPYAKAREMVAHPKEKTRLGLPSLTDLCASVLSRHDQSALNSTYNSASVNNMNVRKMYYYVYPMEDDCVRQVKRRVQISKIKKVYLANTTLVIVPHILVEQWKLEIEKHVAEGTLKVREIGREPLPPVEELLEYNIILMDTTRFGAEEHMHRMHLELEPSELTKARWKRIILDEGHVAGNQTSNAMRLAISLSVERRWLVSGTPTKHLQQGGETVLSTATSTTTEYPSGSSVTSPWSPRDLEDATRLGVMIGGFLAAQPFRSEAGFQDNVVKLLRGKHGPRFGAVQRLRYIMNATMVKHGPHIIDAEAFLPPLTMSTRILRFHPMQRITYNVLTALIASNVYTSNFEDPDYFLHPRNTNSFNTVIRNLHLACFWYSAPEMGVAECIKRTKHHLQNNATVTPDGRVVLEEAVAFLEKALATPGWDEWMTNGVSLPFDVNSADFPELIRQSWSDSMDTQPDAIDSHSLRLLRDLNTSGRTSHELNLTGWESRARKHPDFLSEMEKIAQRAERAEKRQKAEDDPIANSKEDVKAAAHAPVALQKYGKKEKAVSAPRRKRKQDDLDQVLDEAAVNAARTLRADTPLRDLGPRPLPRMINTKSRSAKMNCLLEIIRDSDDSDKFVIFGDVYELGHAVEALDLFKIKLTFVGPGIAASKRAEELKKFEAPDVKVCLLDIKIGARGLNLVVANRIIFLSPVWSLDVQAQAIKRIHRIGQTKPTTIEILVTEGTFEEDIAKRSSNSRSEREEQLYSRALIEKPRFVYLEDEGDCPFPISFLPNGEEQDGWEISPSTGSPDMWPVTPLSARFGADHVRIASPSLQLDAVATMTTEDLKPSAKALDDPSEGIGGKGMQADVQELAEEKPRKRARVAFA